MAINGIGNSWNSFLNYQQSVNNVRLYNALGRYSSSRVSSVKNNYSTSNVNSLLNDSKSFITEYNSSMSKLMSSSNSLRNSNKSSVMNDLTAVSSNKDVASLTTNYKLRDTTNFELNVSQLATSQSNVSEAVSGSALATEDMSLKIEGVNGAIDVNVSSVKENGGQKTNYQMFKEAAEIINSKNVGVNASVEVKDGKAALKLQSSETGAKNGFTVSGSEGAAAGISNVATEAVDAKYSVKKDGVTRNYTSSSNKVDLEYGKITADLKKTGETSVSVGLDTDKVVSSVKELVKNYNDTLDLLNDNYSRGTGVMRQISRMASAPTSERSMALVGITVNDDGTLKLDEDKLRESLTKNTSIARDVIGGSFGLADGAFNDAISGMSTNSVSLINNDMSQQKSYYEDMFGTASRFSRTNPFGISNYTTVGLMFDMLI